jgi:hypothetical protein
MFGEQARLQTMLQQSNPSPVSQTMLTCLIHVATWLLTTARALQVDHEEQLLQQLRQKLGPHADGALLLHHLRMNRGKIHWAGGSCYY